MAVTATVHLPNGKDANQSVCPSQQLNFAESKDPHAHSSSLMLISVTIDEMTALLTYGESG